MDTRLELGVVLDLATITTGDIDLGGLDAACRRWIYHRSTAAAEVEERIASAHVVVTNKVALDRTRLAAAHALRLICIAATGTNNVDLEAARELGIAVTNVTGYATPAVVQHVFAGILAHTTNLAATATRSSPATGHAAPSSAYSTTRSLSWPASVSASSVAASSGRPWHGSPRSSAWRS